MYECIDSLWDAAIFSTADTEGCYWQVPTAEEDKDMATFISHEGTYRFNCTPFVMVNASKTFQRYLDIIFNSLAWKTCLVNIDDIIILSKDYQFHFSDIDSVLNAL